MVDIFRDSATIADALAIALATMYRGEDTNVGGRRVRNDPHRLRSLATRSIRPRAGPTPGGYGAEGDPRSHPAAMIRSLPAGSFQRAKEPEQYLGGASPQQAGPAAEDG